MKQPRTPKTRLLFAALTLAVALILPWHSGSGKALAQEEFYPAQVKDISDRSYEPAVINALDSAKESITISMYVIKPSEKGPVGLLLRDLAEALDRGVTVELYLNTRFKSKSSASGTDFRQKPFKALKQKGAVIHPVDPNYRLHDKLIIVDSRYVIEGSHNWSVSALKSNFESATLTDSPELAREKLKRVRSLPLESDKPGRIRRRYLGGEPEPLPENAVIRIKKILLENKSFFPRMVKYHDDRSMDAYLLLLAEAEKWAVYRKEHPPARGEGTRPGEDLYFPVSLEDMAGALEITSISLWPNTSNRRQVIKTLRKLQDKYKLIDVNFQYGEDAWVTIKEPPGDTFTMRSSFFDPAFLSSKSTSAKFVLLMKALLGSEGKEIDSCTRKELTENFHIGLNTLRKGMREVAE